ncbi:hypothetical protein EV656_104242 [Rhodovulum adriaticum]|uniref:Uncharacterized protein n=1 Tax=Rhodovulum adriaticum TaxID=35804 RepID=A0A4R2NNK6_RHOAD|nr:hypothetical protein EV656_104242 [Rhodovulum adriaticum]
MNTVYFTTQDREARDMLMTLMLQPPEPGKRLPAEGGQRVNLGSEFHREGPA